MLTVSGIVRVGANVGTSTVMTELGVVRALPPCHACLATIDLKEVCSKVNYVDSSLNHSLAWMTSYRTSRRRYRACMGRNHGPIIPAWHAGSGEKKSQSTSAVFALQTGVCKWLDILYNTIQYNTIPANLSHGRRSMDLYGVLSRRVLTSPMERDDGVTGQRKCAFIMVLQLNINRNASPLSATLNQA